MRNLILILIMLLTPPTWAHGEDRPGPHGGFISMPGPFHVELVLVGERRVKAYLLDMNWENPTLTESSVELVQGRNSAKCTAKENHFDCEFPIAVNLTKTGELQVKAKREKEIGQTAYSLPFKRALKR